MISTVFAGVGFLTIVPMRGRIGRASFAAFPLLGATIGALLGVLWMVSSAHMSRLGAGAVVVVADAIITGALHLDAIADCGDGLIAHLDRPDRLRVMADPHLGAFGAVALLMVELSRYAALASTPAKFVVLLVGYGISRSVMAAVALYLPAAKQGSIISAFGGSRQASLGVAIAVALSVQLGILVVAGDIFLGWQFLLALGVGILASGALLARSYFALGGVTGDVVGASGMVFEVAFLLALLR